MKRVKHKSDKIILNPNQYDSFIENWIRSYCTYGNL